MKKLILLFLGCILLSANDLFLYDSTENVELSEVINNKLKNLTVQSGKTYGLSNGLSIITKTNDFATYTFPYKIAINQLENTSVFFSQYETTYKNDFKLPTLVIVKESNFNFSFDGEIYCINDTTNEYNIGTSMGFINFGKAKFFAKSGTKYTHVYLVEGKITVLDSKSNKRKELKPDNYLVITPQINLSPRSNNAINPGNSFSIREVEDLEKEIHVKELNKLKNKLDNVLFINYDTNIFGIKLQQ
jgi:hypothetical protein